MSGETRPSFMEIYNVLSAYYGPTGWWPGDSPFEIAVGAILTQNTAWSNVEKAIANLKKAKLLSPRRILRCDRALLEEAIRPSGYFRQKAERLIAFCRYLMEQYGGDMGKMCNGHVMKVREELLRIKGIGPETADDILLYSCGYPIFVVDAYTKRIFSRHGLLDSGLTYQQVQEIFHREVPKDVHIYKEYHGLIVWVGKDFCKKKPKCSTCPLNRFPIVERVEEG